MAFAMIKNRLDVLMMQLATTTQMQRPMMVLVLSSMNAVNAVELASWGASFFKLVIITLRPIARTMDFVNLSLALVAWMKRRATSIQQLNYLVHVNILH